ncbi:MAG: hypothetical protein IPL47_17295 [Phyllobacteriaceae bacterium]|nr:hypothetical protein [Phyllobacteriaceae bacterium]
MFENAVEGLIRKFGAEYGESVTAVFNGQRPRQSFAQVARTFGVVAQRLGQLPDELGVSGPGLNLDARQPAR